MKHDKIIIAGIVILLVLSGLNLFKTDKVVQEEVKLEGWDINNSTTTDSTYAFEDFTVLKTRAGTLGSIIVTGSGTSAITLYDATTTDIINGNSARKATSSLIMAIIPASPTAGTYVYNTSFKDGLLIDLGSQATLSTTTITWK